MSQAFLPGTVKEDINIEHPYGFVQRKSNNSVYEILRKSLYGVKQAAWPLNIAWREMMQTLHFKEVVLHACVNV